MFQRSCYTNCGSESIKHAFCSAIGGARNSRANRGICKNVLDLSSEGGGGQGTVNEEVHAKECHCGEYDRV